jgi:hypothetical protein
MSGGRLALPWLCLAAGCSFDASRLRARPDAAPAPAIDGAALPADATADAPHADTGLVPPTPADGPASSPDADPDGPSCVAGVAMLCGRGTTGLVCYSSDRSGTFVLLGRTTFWSDSEGFGASPSLYGTIAAADLDGDGDAELCARGSDGVECAPWRGTAWTNLGPLVSLSDADGFTDPAHWTTIHYPDVDGDGRADLCFRGRGGIECAAKFVLGFTSVTSWSDLFSDARGWRTVARYGTLQYPDLDGDRRADVCGRSDEGIVCGISDGSRFADVKVWSPALSDAQGWSDRLRWATVQFPDVNGDRRADLCARAADGIRCALSDGGRFGALQLWASSFDDHDWALDESRWTTISYPDLDGDGRADVCGRSPGGLTCGRSTGRSFDSIRLWSDFFNDNVGWADRAYAGSIQFGDIDGDGRADVCARWSDGIYCGSSNGADAFSLPTRRIADFRDADGWLAPPYASTILLHPFRPGTCPTSPRPPFLRGAARGYL